MEAAQFETLNKMKAYPMYHIQWSDIRGTIKTIKKENNKSHPLFVSAFKFNAQIWGLAPSYSERKQKPFLFPIEGEAIQTPT